MQTKSLSLVFVLLVVAVASLTVSAGSESATHDIIDKAALDEVTLEVVIDGDMVGYVTVDEERMGSAYIHGTEGAVGFKPENISLRGDAIRLALYSLDDPRDANRVPGKWIEDLELAKGDAALMPPKLSEKMGPRLTFRLVDVKLANR
ncbi:MAG: hypothetical protein AAF604_11285 [Acidobacteriota bacterium]